MKATILIDNIAPAQYRAEWGFCVHIVHNGKQYLLDTGGSSLFVQNAKAMGIDLSAVDHAVLSHAHIDHSGGYSAFFAENQHAFLHVSSACQEDCCFRIGPFRKYVGVPKGLLSRQKERIVRAEGCVELEPGVWLVPHRKNHLELLGKKAHMYRMINGRTVPDDFAHEISLVFETGKGLVVFNSCSHGGLENIVKDVQYYLPGRPIHMTVGGMHLAAVSSAEVRRLSETIKALGIDVIYTGHCTGKRAFRILQQALNERIQQTYVGEVIEV